MGISCERLFYLNRFKPGSGLSKGVLTLTKEYKADGHCEHENQIRYLVANTVHC